MSRQAPTLKRGLNLPLLLLYGVGNILGAGIYVLVGRVAASAGYHAPLAFLVAAAVAAFSALSYVELSTRFPVSAGEAVYVQHGFGRAWLSRLTGLLVCASGIISAATLSRGFVGYLHLFFAFPDGVVIIVLVALLCGIAVIGITESVGVAALFTVLEVGGLLLVIWVARDALGALPESLPDLLPPLSIVPWAGIFAGAFLSFFAFIGFEDMVNVAEEVKEPQSTLPRAILLALLVCTIMYVAIATVAVLAVPPATLGESNAPLALLYRSTTGTEPVFIGVIAMFAIVNGILIQVIMVSRMLYGMADRGWLPATLARVHVRYRTPVVATLLVGVIIAALGVMLPFVALAAATSLAVLGVFALSNGALIVIKQREPTAPDAVEVPAWIPVAGLMTALMLAGGNFLVTT